MVGDVFLKYVDLAGVVFLMVIEFNQLVNSGGGG